MSVRKCAYKYVFSSAMGINRSVYFEKKMCLLLFKHEIHLTVLHPDRKQCSLMFRVKIKESLFYICAYEKKKNPNSLFANYALFFYTVKADF